MKILKLKITVDIKFSLLDSNRDISKILLTKVNIRTASVAFVQYDSITFL